MNRQPNTRTKRSTSSNVAFQVVLRRVRAQQNLSIRGLAKKSGLHYSYISGLENGARSCGPASAARLADALHLRAEARAELLLAASRTSRLPFVQDHRGYPAEVLGLTASALLNRGVRAKDIQKITRFSGGVRNSSDSVLELDLGRGKKAVLVVEVKLQGHARHRRGG